MNESIQIILRFYKRINSLTTKFDELISRAALRSYKSPGFSAADCIMHLIDKKVKLINLKCIIDTAVSNLSYEKQKVAMCFMRGMRTTDITECGGLSRRTGFRRISQTLSGVEKIFNTMGFDKLYFEREYKDFLFFDASKDIVYYSPQKKAVYQSL